MRHLTGIYASITMDDTPDNGELHSGQLGESRRGYWMRSVQFAGLHRIAHCVMQQPDGIRAGELNTQILARNLYRTERGLPAKSTMYHCRNTLLHLGVLRHSRNKLFVATDDPVVDVLLHTPPPDGDLLNNSALDTFRTLVLRNRDCVQSFFRLFLPNTPSPTLDQFSSSAIPVVWHQPTAPKGSRIIELRATDSEDVLQLTSPVEIQSILYGVRYWARDQLGLIDEFFEAGRGSIMYPIRMQGPLDNADVVLKAILGFPRDPGEWTTISVNRLLKHFCESQGFRVDTVFAGVHALISRHTGRIVLIPTIPSIAAISATSRHREDFELRAYFRDSQGRLISHLRFHNSLHGNEHGQREANHR